MYMESTVDRISAFIFDLDGCIYSGNKVYEGSLEFLTYLIKEKKEIYFLSNNSTNQSETVRRKLMKMGLPVENTTIFVATDLIGEYLFEHHGPVHIQVIGTNELKESLERQGHTICPLDDEGPCDFVVVGRDPSFTYQTLSQCARSVMKGAKLIATNLDLYHPGEDGNRVPETGALMAAIQAVSGVDEVPFIGKPFIYPFRKIMDETGHEPERCVMVGDNPYTDVAGAYGVGVKTIWISHGHTFPDKLECKPDFTFESMKGLAESFMKNIK